MSAQFPRWWSGQDRAQFEVLILCHDSTGCDETGDYFATEANTRLDIVRLT